MIKTLESLRSRFFWGGTDNKKKISWVAWDCVLRDKNCGGLGIGSLRAANLAMLAKWWWRNRTEPKAIWRKVVHNCGEMGIRRDYRGVWHNITRIEKDLGDIGINLQRLMHQKENGNGWEWDQSSKTYWVRSLRNMIDAIALPISDQKTEWCNWIPSKVNILIYVAGFHK